MWGEIFDIQLLAVADKSAIRSVDALFEIIIRWTSFIPRLHGGIISCLSFHLEKSRLQTAHNFCLGVEYWNFWKIHQKKAKILQKPIKLTDLSGLTFSTPHQSAKWCNVWDRAFLNIKLRTRVRVIVAQNSFEINDLRSSWKMEMNRERFFWIKEKLDILHSLANPWEFALIIAQAIGNEKFEFFNNFLQRANNELVKLFNP